MSKVLQAITVSGYYRLYKRGMASDKYQERLSEVRELLENGAVVRVGNGDDPLVVTSKEKTEERARKLNDFKSDLKSLLEKYGAVISFSVSECSDTHGLNDEKMVVSIDDNDNLLCHGWDIDHRDI